MQASSVVHNIIKTCKNNNMNILSDSTSSLFDNYLSTIEDLCVFSFNSRHYYDDISYDLILSNSPITFSTQIQDISTIHLNSIVYFHNKSPASFKKEDKFLLKNSINRIYKIFPDEITMRDWGFVEKDNAHIINYGIKIRSNNFEKKRSVVVLNTNNNSSVNTMYKYINSVFPDAVLINSIEDNNYIHNILEESAICVCAESSYNMLEAVANECYVLTASKELTEDGIFIISSYNDIISNLQELLQKYNPLSAKIFSNNILKKYCHNIFKKHFIELLEFTRRKPYLYVKNNQYLSS